MKPEHRARPDGWGRLGLRSLAWVSLLLQLVAGTAWGQVSTEADAATGLPAPSSAAPAGVLTRAPVLLNFVEAVRPAGLEATEATVLLRLQIGVDGRVKDAVVERPAGASSDDRSAGAGGSAASGLDALDAAARTASLAFTFSPAEVDGRPAEVQLVYRYDFTVAERTVEVPVGGSPVGVLRGELQERGSRKPLAGVTVVMTLDAGESPAGDSGARDLAVPVETYSDGDGRFEFTAVRAGRVRISINDPAYYRVDDDEAVLAGQATEVKYYLEPASLNAGAMIVVGKRVKKDVSRQTLTLTEIRKIPGTSGDALKVIQNLPGVARIPFGGAQLIVRGSNPGDSAAVINRHVIPLAFHFGGLRSVFSSSLLESIDFYPGNFGAEFGRFSGGIVDVRVKRPETDRLHGYVEADFFDAGLLLEGPVGEHGAFALAARRSYIDVLLPFFLPEEADLDFTIAPRYYDYQAIYDYKHGRHRLKLYLFGSDDVLTFLLSKPADADPAFRGEFKNETGFYRGYLSWAYRVNDAVEHEFSVSVGRNHLFFRGTERLFFDNRLTAITARDEVSVQMNDRLELRTGFDFEGFVGRVAINAPMPPKEGDDQNGGTPLSTLKLIRVNRTFNLSNPALWMELRSKVTDDLQVIPGARVDYDHRLRDATIDPRVQVRWAFDEALTLKGGVGMYMQRPLPDESDPDFGNPDIELEKSVHTTLGAEYIFGDGLSLDGNTFFKYMYEQVTLDRAEVADAFQRGMQAAGATTTGGIPYKNQGKGRVYGLELLLRKQVSDRFFGWVSYTLARAERSDVPGEPWRVFDFDQTHSLTMLGQYKLNRAWEFGLRWRFVTGNPDTPYDGCVYDSDTDTCAPRLAGDTNSARLPSFHQLDLRVDRNWTFDLWKLTAYLEIQNAYNRQNPEGVQYNYDYSDSLFISGTPVIPSFGLRGEL